MNTLLKAGCMAIYLLALASFFFTFAWGMGLIFQIIALGLLCVHALEAVVMFKHIKTYQGPLLHSLLLALLFGLLHWLPLAKANRALPRA